MKNQSNKESAAVQEGKSYAYQSPQESKASGGSPLDEQKRKVVDAFDDFMDALVCRAGDSPGEGSGAGTGMPSVGGTGQMTGSGTSSGAGTATGAGTSTAVATVPSVAAGSPVMGKAGNGGAKPNEGEKASEAAKAAMERDNERSVYALREAYQLDVTREARRKAERARESSVAKDGIPVVIGVGKNKHMSDSNRAPISELKEFHPAYGSAGKSSGRTPEVASLPLSKRPETVPTPGFVTIGKPLDAFFGSFGTAIEKAKERARVDQRFEVVLGTDDRVRVTSNEAYPWRCICSLLITANTGMSYIGTGWLVGPRLVLTAGHCVFMSDENGWVSQIEVIPGRDANSRPFGSAIARDFRSVTGWTQDNDSNYDYGAILLPPENRYGEQLGWFGYTNRADDYLRNITLNLSGYPGDGGKTNVDGTQWFHSRRVRDVFDRQITYEIDTFGGQSGAPVWEMTSDGSRYGVAIHTYGTSVNNGGTRITSDVFDNIVQWAGQVP